MLVSVEFWDRYNIREEIMDIEKAPKSRIYKSEMWLQKKTPLKIY